MRGRRQTKRRPITATATITVLIDHSVMAPFDGTVINISPGGAGLSAKRPVTTGSEMEVNLKFVDPEGEQCQEAVEGWVVWRKEMPPFCFFGVVFSGLNEREHPNLLRYLRVQENQDGTVRSLRHGPREDGG